VEDLQAALVGQGAWLRPAAAQPMAKAGASLAAGR